MAKVNGRKISFVASHELAEAIEDFAAEQGISMSAAIRVALSGFLHEDIDITTLGFQEGLKEAYGKMMDAIETSVREVFNEFNS